MSEGDLKQKADHERRENQRTVYKQICESYRAIDVFRGTLLGTLPLVSGGTFLLIGTDVIVKKAEPSLLLPLGVFGFLVTLGLFIYEIYAAKRCTELIRIGRALEVDDLRVDGQFEKRPRGIEGFHLISRGNSQRITPYISEPLASGIIYPAVLGAWVFVALSQLPAIPANMREIRMDAIASEMYKVTFGILVLFLGFWASWRYTKWLDQSGEPTHVGGIVFRWKRGVVEYLLVGPKKEVSREWLLPKGPINENEKKEHGAAALRKVQEETGVLARWIGLVDSTEFSTEPKKIKVQYYLMESMHESESSESRRKGWFDLEKALELLTHDKNKRLLQQAEKIRTRGTP